MTALPHRTVATRGDLISEGMAVAKINRLSPRPALGHMPFPKHRTVADWS